METPKLRVVINYEKLSDVLIEQIKLVYPRGFQKHLISFFNDKGEKVTALRLETADKIYLVRMSVTLAKQIVEEDSDYDDTGKLKAQIKEQYEEEHSDAEYLSENENYREEDY